MGGDIGVKMGRFYRNMYKGHLDNIKAGLGSRVWSVDDWGGVEWWESNCVKCT